MPQEENVKNSYIFSNEEVRRISELGIKEWLKIRPTVVKTKDFDLEKRDEALAEIKELLDSYGKTYYLSGGALLGAVREKGDYIKGDDDVEFDMLAEDFVQIMYDLKEKLLEKNFVVRLVAKDEYPKVSFFRDGNDFTVCAVVKEKDKRSRTYYHVPAHFYDNPEKITLRGMEFDAPSPKEDFLTYCYNDWKTPKKDREASEYYGKDFIKKFPLHIRIRNKIKNFWLGL